MSTSAMRYTAAVKQHGLTLIELIIFIVVVSVGIAGILMVLNVTVWHSADPMIRKNMLSIAEALVEEVQMMPFTYCDPTDANAATATGAGTGPGQCATIVENLGVPNLEAGQTRTNTANPYNNVNDYADPLLVLSDPIKDITNNPMAPAGYSATIQIVPESLNGITSDSTSANMKALRIAVKVTHGSDSITVEGYRTRYAPNFLP